MSWSLYATAKPMLKLDLSYRTSPHHDFVRKAHIQSGELDSLVSDSLEPILPKTEKNKKEKPSSKGKG